MISPSGSLEARRREGERFTAGIYPRATPLPALCSGMRERPPWKVLASWENPAADRCVDIFLRPDGSYGFEEYRRDPEDRAWSPFAYHAHRSFADRAACEAAARATVSWLDRR